MNDLKNNFLKSKCKTSNNSFIRNSSNNSIDLKHLPLDRSVDYCKQLDSENNRNFDKKELNKINLSKKNQFVERLDIDKIQDIDDFELKTENKSCVNFLTDLNKNENENDNEQSEKLDKNIQENDINIENSYNDNNDNNNLDEIGFLHKRLEINSLHSLNSGEYIFPNKEISNYNDLKSKNPKINENNKIKKSSNDYNFDEIINGDFNDEENDCNPGILSQYLKENNNTKLENNNKDIVIKEKSSKLNFIVENNDENISQIKQINPYLKKKTNNISEPNLNKIISDTNEKNTVEFKENVKSQMTRNKICNKIEDNKIKSGLSYYNRVTIDDLASNNCTIINTNPQSYYYNHFDNFLQFDKSNQDLKLKKLTKKELDEYTYLFNQKLKYMEEELRKKMKESPDIKRKRIVNVKNLVEEELRKELEEEVKDKLKAQIDLECYNEYNLKKQAEMEKVKRKIDMIYKEKVNTYNMKLKEKIQKEISNNYNDLMKVKEQEIQVKYNDDFIKYKESKKTQIYNEFSNKDFKLKDEYDRLKSELEEMKIREMNILKDLNNEQNELNNKVTRQKNNILELEKVLENSKNNYVKGWKKNEDKTEIITKSFIRENDININKNINFNKDNSNTSVNVNVKDNENNNFRNDAFDKNNYSYKNANLNFNEHSTKNNYIKLNNLNNVNIVDRPNLNIKTISNLKDINSKIKDLGKKENIKNSNLENSDLYDKEKEKIRYNYDECKYKNNNDNYKSLIPEINNNEFYNYNNQFDNNEFNDDLNSFDNNNLNRSIEKMNNDFNDQSEYKLILKNECMSLNVDNLTIPKNFEEFSEFLKRFLDQENIQKTLYLSLKEKLLKTLEEKSNMEQININLEKSGFSNIKNLKLIKQIFELWKKIDLSYNQRYSIVNFMIKLHLVELSKFLEKEVNLLSLFYYETCSVFNLIRKKENLKFNCIKENKCKMFLK